ncbi:AraC family transcriptional regulator [Victivallis sp. Marseille-Q1083]|uniref:helix-turn-helix domain-containing protein n=1 Tax=Victivallis sp. Marseille-Q1083 TaxID=2717288 RepID=UPI00158BFA7D|nr:AraC family transcriptional regulator [Victivallis sp. Marseille-Q1083]
MEQKRNAIEKNPEFPWENFSRNTRAGLDTDPFYDSGMNILYANSGRRTINPKHELRYFEFYSLTHLYEGEGIFEVPGQAPAKVKAGQGILICPGFVHYYGQVDARGFVEDNVCFAGPVADIFRQKGFIHNGLVDIGEYRTLLPICQLIARGGSFARMKAGIMLQQLLLDFYEKSANFGHITASRTAIEELLLAISVNPMRWWTVNEMAEYCNLDLQKFRRTFIRTTGIHPKKYLDSFKMSLAKSWLQKTDWPLDKISHCLGYQDRYHFSRRFKQLIGIAPEFFRRQQLSMSEKPDFN